MALKVELQAARTDYYRPCVITNTDQRARLLIDGDKFRSCAKRIS